MTLEEQIKHYRKQAGLSQEKMAEIKGNGTSECPDVPLLFCEKKYVVNATKIRKNELD